MHIIKLIITEFLLNKLYYNKGSEFKNKIILNNRIISVVYY